MDPIEIQSQEQLNNYLNEFGSIVSLRSRKSGNSLADGPNEKDSVCKSQEFYTVSFEISEDVEDPCESAQNELSESDDSSGNRSDDEDHDGDEKKIEKHAWRRFIGLGLAMMACVAFSLSSLIVKYLHEYHPFTKCVWRFHGLLIPSIPMMIYSRAFKKEPIFDTISPLCEDQRWRNGLFLVLRSAAGFGTIVCQFYALHYITLADQLVIAGSQPVFVTIVAYFMLGESIGVVPIVMCFVTLIGVGIVTRPPILTGADGFNEDVLIGTAFSLGSMAMSVGSIVFTRRMKEVHFTLILFCFAVFSIIAGGIIAAAMNVFTLPQGENHTILVIMMAGLVFISQFCTTVALKHEQAGLVSLTRACSIVFAFGWQFIFLGVVPDIFSVVGASIIAVGVTLVAIRKWISTLPENDATKMRLKFLLK